MSIRNISLIAQNANLSDTEENLLANIRLKFITSFLWSRESISFSKFSYTVNSNISLMQNEIIRTIIFKWAIKEEYCTVLRKFAKKEKISLEINKTLRDVIDVGYNEYNALMIIKFVYEVSLAIPRIKIKLQDEGDCLYCPIIVQNGKASPDYKAIELELEKVAEGVVSMRESKMNFYALLLADKKNKKYAQFEMSMFLRPLLDVDMLTPNEQFYDKYYNLLCAKTEGELSDQVLNFIEKEIECLERSYENLNYFPL